MIEAGASHLYCINSVTQERRLVAVNHADKLQILDEDLKRIMEQSGIVVPHSEIKTFGGRKVIYLDDPDPKLFKRAFHEIYYPMSMSKKTFVWMDTSLKTTQPQSLP